MAKKRQRGRHVDLSVAERNRLWTVPIGRCGIQVLAVPQFMPGCRE